jgi:hypothetical protein
VDSSAPGECEAAVTGESINADVRSLTMRVDLWKGAWGGINHWDSHRDKCVDCELSQDDIQRYLDHLAVGNDLLDACFILLQSSDAKLRADNAFQLASQVVSLATDLSTGLERLRL